MNFIECSDHMKDQWSKLKLNQGLNALKFQTKTVILEFRQFYL